MHAASLIESWLASRVTPGALAWLRERADHLSAGAPESDVHLAFSLALRHAGKGPLNLDDAALAEAARTVEGWNPRDWTLDQAARIRLLLALPPTAESARLMDRLYETADVGETLALQKALPLLPNPELHMARAREAIRSNVKLQFEALALRNPYAAKHVDEIGWNQLVTKTFFVDSPLPEVWGLDARANAALGRMLTDLAFERWAAGRAFHPMLWRCVGPVAGPEVPRAFDGLAKALAGSDRAQRRAATLALAASKAAEAAPLLAKSPELPALKSGALTWETLDAP